MSVTSAAATIATYFKLDVAGIDSESVKGGIFTASGNAGEYFNINESYVNINGGASHRIAELPSEVAAAAQSLYDCAKRAAALTKDDLQCPYCKQTHGLCESVCVHLPEEEAPKTLVVTRHQALIEYLLEIGVIAEGDYEVIQHASGDAVKGRDVIGVLPHSLSSLTATFTEVPLQLPPELRGKELSVQDLRKYAQKPVTYKVTVV